MQMQVQIRKLLQIRRPATMMPLPPLLLKQRRLRAKQPAIRCRSPMRLLMTLLAPAMTTQRHQQQRKNQTCTRQAVYKKLN